MISSFKNIFCFEQEKNQNLNLKKDFSEFNNSRYEKNLEKINMNQLEKQAFYEEINKKEATPNKKKSFSINQLPCFQEKKKSLQGSCNKILFK